MSIKKFFFLILFFASNATQVYADTPDPENFRHSLEWSLWTFHSDAWSGYIDFQNNGLYWTHGGYGHWSVTAPGQIRLQNDSNPYSHRLTFESDGNSYHGTRNDGATVVGKLLLRKYIEDLVIGNSAEEQSILKNYREILGREPDPEGFRYFLGLARKGVSLLEIQKMITALPEARSREASSSAAATDDAKDRSY